MAYANTIEEALAILADPDETELNCYNLGLGPEEARQIAEALPHSQVRRITIDNNNIGDEGAAHIARALPHSQVRSLFLNVNNIGDEGAVHIARALPHSQVTTLYLDNNNIGSEGAARIAKALPKSQVTTLYLDNNNIGDEGAAHIARALPHSQVTTLYLYSNNIGSEGAAHLAQAWPHSQVTWLTLTNNNIGDAQLEAIKAQGNARWGVAKTTAASLKNLTGQVTAELWQDVSRFPAVVKLALDSNSLLDGALQSALKQGFSVQEFVFRSRPLAEAVDYLDEIGQPARTAKDLLAEDLSLPEEHHYAAARLVSIPDAWESKAQAVHVRRQLPEALRDILPWQKLYLALHRRTQHTTEAQR